MSKFFIKKTRVQATVKISGSGSETITLAELALEDQELDNSNVIVSISGIVASLGANTTITRGGNVVIHLVSGAYDFNLGQYGAILEEEPNEDIVINLGGSDGTLILNLNKSNGYIDPNFQQFPQYLKP